MNDSFDDTDAEASPPVRVNIVVDPASAPEITIRLGEAGLELVAEYGVLGVVSGTTSAEALDRLRTVEGVLAVEVDRTDLEATSGPTKDQPERLLDS